MECAKGRKGRSEVRKTNKCETKITIPLSKWRKNTNQRIYHRSNTVEKEVNGHLVRREIEELKESVRETSFYCGYKSMLKSEVHVTEKGSLVLQDHSHSRATHPLVSVILKVHVLHHAVKQKARKG